MNTRLIEREYSQKKRSGSRCEPLLFQPYTHAVNGTGKSSLTDTAASRRPYLRQSSQLARRPAQRRGHIVESISSLKFTSFGLSIHLGKSTNTATVLTDFQALFQALGVAPQSLVGIQCGLMVRKERVQRFGLAWLNAVINPFASLTRRDKSRLSNGLQMSRKRGLAHLHCIRQLANTQLALSQCGENANARRVGQGFGKKNQVIHGCIVKSGYDDMLTRLRFPVNGQIREVAQ